MACAPLRLLSDLGYRLASPTVHAGKECCSAGQHSTVRTFPVPRAPTRTRGHVAAAAVTAAAVAAAGDPARTGPGYIATRSRDNIAALIRSNYRRTN